MILLIIIVALALVVWFFPALFATVAQLAFRAPKTDQRIIALTFDDGPNPPYTNRLLEILAKHSVLATFFVVGRNLEKYPEIGKAIVGGGHSIGNHSYSHQFKKYITNPYFESEISLTQKSIEKITGKIPNLYRSPWLFQNPLLMKTVRMYKLNFISGIFGSQREIRGRSAEGIAKDALKVATPGGILIFHDGFDAQGADRSKTIEAIDILIPRLKDQGYQFVTVDTLYQISPYQNI